MKRKTFITGIFIIVIIFIACTKNPTQVIFDNNPIPLTVGQQWKMSGSEVSVTFKTYSVESTKEIDGKQAFVIKECWIQSTIETASFIYAYQWDDPLFKIYYKAGNSWEQMYAFKLFLNDEIEWGFYKSNLIEKVDIQTPYTVIYPNCFMYKCINQLNNKESWHWIKEGVGFVKTKNEFGKEDYLVQPPQ